VSTDSRSKLLPDIPTAKESGLKDFVATSWFGAFVPAGTPDPIVDKLNAAINRVTSRPEIVERLATYGAEVVASDPASFQKYVAEEVTRWRDVVTKSGMDVND
jgi:tripartite-type tricarboxylate transporter receptor subunit TctC